MEIERAASFAFDNLTLQEKTLAREIVRFQYYDVQRLNAFYRAPVLFMDQVLKHFADSAQQSKTTPRRISIYCDTLVITETCAFLGKDTFFCNITARQIHFSKAEDGPAFRMYASRKSRLLINAQQLPTAFQVEFVDEKNQKEQKRVVIPEGSFGISYTEAGKGCAFKEEVYVTGPEMELQTENWMNLINEDGTMKGVPFTTDNLPRLLNFEYIMAAAVAYDNPKLALSILNWICAATKTAGGSLLGAQAQSLRNSIAADNGGMISSVPSLNVYSCKQILKSRLQAAKAFEDSFRDYTSEERNATSWAYLAADLLRKSDQALEEYGFLSSLARKRYNEAVEAADYAEAQFKKTQKLVNEASDKFKKDVADWELEQKLTAAKDIFLGLIAVGVAIAATVATAGAAAPAAVGATAKVVVTGTKVAQAIAKVKEIIEKIKEIYEKLQPIIEKLGELFKSIQAMVAAIESAQSALELPQSLKEGEMKLDALNATAQWDIFDVQVGLLEKQFAALGIPNQDKYLFALRSLVVYGKTYLQSQVNVVVRGDELATIQLRLKQQQDSRPAIEAMMTRFVENKELISVLKIAMFDRLLAIRALIYVDFNSYANAYAYHTLETNSPVRLSAVKPVVDYFGDAARLQSAISAFGSQASIQRKSFTLTQAALGLDLVQVAKGIKEEGKFTFSIRPTLSEFEGFYRIRVVCARIYLHGIASETERKVLRLALKTTGRFVDVAPPRKFTTASSTYAFTGDARTVIFETDLAKSELVTCDGEYGQAKDYTIQTPFTEWTVALAKGGLTAEELSVDGLDAVSLELVCDVCYSEDL